MLLFGCFLFMFGYIIPNYNKEVVEFLDYLRAILMIFGIAFVVAYLKRK